MKKLRPGVLCSRGSDGLHCAVTRALCSEGPGLGVNALVIVLKLLIIILSLNSVFPK